jgi:hypothetical protein
VCGAFRKGREECANWPAHHAASEWCPEQGWVVVHDEGHARRFRKRLRKGGQSRCPHFRSRHLERLYLVERYYVFGQSPGHFMIPSIEAYREYCMSPSAGRHPTVISVESDVWQRPASQVFLPTRLQLGAERRGEFARTCRTWQRSGISTRREATQARLPPSDPFLGKMAATKRGSSPVSVAVRGRSSTHPTGRRRAKRLRNSEPASHSPSERI